MTHTPTAEQIAALELFADGRSFVIEAGAGTGKTSTLLMLAESTTRRCQYVAFNKSIVVEAGTKFPSNVKCSTAHSLAFGAVGKHYSKRLNSPRMKPDQIARMLRCDGLDVRFGDGVKLLGPAFIGSLAMQTVGNFARSADREISERHVPYVDAIDLPDANGRRTYENNDLVQEHVLPYAEAAWADIVRTDGQLKFEHDHYLKIWQLGSPRITADVIFFDEAQDADPVMADIVAQQTHAQIVYVGDSQQAIYEWRGAVNALAGFAADRRTFLSQSFRFGPAVAEIANTVLSRIPDAELRLTGTTSISSTVAPLTAPKAVLCRTNAAALQSVMTAQADGRRPHLIGGGREIAAFARGARDLKAGRRSEHADLAWAASWGEVVSYVQNDPAGADLKLLVKLVDDFGVEAILAALDRMPTEENADLIVSTAHKSKGREWETVQLHADFAGAEDREPSVAELRLLYVAVTRAQIVLDMTAVEALLRPQTAAQPVETDDDGLDGYVIDADRDAWVDGVEPVAPLRHSMIGS